MCEECINKILKKITKEEVQILQLLIKKKCVNPQLTLDKTKIASELNIKDYRLNNFLGRLELINVIDKITSCRVNSFYITKEGIELINIYKKEVFELVK